MRDIQDIERLRKVALAAEMHPDGAPSKGWGQGGSGGWQKSREKKRVDVMARIHHGHTYGGRWSNPYSRCYDFNANSTFDLPADTVLAAMEAADLWMKNPTSIPKNAQIFKKS